MMLCSILGHSTKHSDDTARAHFLFMVDDDKYYKQGATASDILEHIPTPLVDTTTNEFRAFQHAINDMLPFSLYNAINLSPVKMGRDFNSFEHGHVYIMPYTDDAIAMVSTTAISTNADLRTQLLKLQGTIRLTPEEARETLFARYQSINMVSRRQAYTTNVRGDQILGKIYGLFETELNRLDAEIVWKLPEGVLASLPTFDSSSYSGGYCCYSPTVAPGENSPLYSVSSPSYISSSPRYWPSSPTTPGYDPNSPEYAPSSPSYSLRSPSIAPSLPGSPQYAPSSPSIAPSLPGSPQYAPVSPCYYAPRSHSIAPSLLYNSPTHVP